MRLAYIVMPPPRIRIPIKPSSCATSPPTHLSKLSTLSTIALATVAAALIQAPPTNPNLHIQFPTQLTSIQTRTLQNPHIKPSHVHRTYFPNRVTAALPVLNPVPRFPARPNLSTAEEAEIITRMLVAVIVGATIGVERRAASATAGVRTLTLVSLGSAIFSLTALHGLGGDPARMGAAISTGIGFLGSGAINGQIMGSRRQLVTAASIWIAAALGVAAAAGLFKLAISGAFVTLWILRWRLIFALAVKAMKDMPGWHRSRVPILPADEYDQEERKEESDVMR